MTSQLTIDLYFTVIVSDLSFIWRLTRNFKVRKLIIGYEIKKIFISECSITRIFIFNKNLVFLNDHFFEFFVNPLCSTVLRFVIIHGLRLSPVVKVRYYKPFGQLKIYIWIIVHIKDWTHLTVQFVWLGCITYRALCLFVAALPAFRLHLNNGILTFGKLLSTTFSHLRKHGAITPCF